MKTLVTGGAGFIGSHLTRRLLELGHEVRVVDNLITGHLENLDGVRNDIDLRQEDLRDAAVCARAVDGVEVVFHVAALSSVPRSIVDPVATHEHNVQASFLLLDAARREGVRRFVYSASSSAYGDAPALPKAETSEPLPMSPYAAAKLSAEVYTLSYARAGLIEGVALRYFNVFGPRQDPNGPYAAVIPLMFKAATTGTPMPIFGDGGQTRDFTYVSNVVDANLAAATGDARRVNGWSVNVGAGRQTSLRELAAMIGEVTGREIELEHRAPRKGDIRDSLADLTRAREVLGYQPRVSVREGLELLWAWFESNEGQVASGASGAH
jgi:UDP-glucose 4-epimerase